MRLYQRWRRKLRQRRENDRQRRGRRAALEALEPRLMLAVVDWTGDIPDGTVWSGSDVHRITGNVRVPAGATLTIQPGAVVKFNYFTLGLSVDGTLQAQGTAGAPITFTDIRDDSVGGDTDGVTAVSVPGNWSRIEVAAGGSATMEHVQIRYGGYSSAGQLTVSGGALTLRNSTVAHASVDGVRVVNANPTLQDNRYENNAWSAISMDLASNPVITGVTLVNNGTNGLRVDGGEMNANGFWDDPAIVYVTNGDITVAAGNKLTVGAGQVVKFGYFTYDLFVNGTLDAQGTGATPIVFTDARDDTAGGDTNNNGEGSPSVPGNWGRIELTGPANVLKHVDVRYGGYSSLAQLAVVGGQLSYTDGKLQRSSVAGLRIESSNPTITRVEFLNNVGAAARMDLASNPAISGSSPVVATGNSVNGLLVDGGAMSTDGSWDDPDIVYVTDGDITVATGKKLTVGAGQVVKFGYFTHDLFVNGTLDAIGAPLAPIVFTDFRDDTAGGDTNNNGDGSQSGPGNWGRIELVGPDSALDYVQLRYGGYSSTAQLQVSGGSASITNGVLRASSAGGLAVLSSGSADINNTLIEGNAGDGLTAAGNAALNAVNNTIDGHRYGVNASDRGTLVALTNNIITNYRWNGVFVQSQATVSVFHNDVFNATAGTASYAGLADPTGQNGNIAADPKYVDRASGDFHLLADSPAIDAGTSTAAPNSDLDFTWRVDNPNVANTGAGSSPFFDLGALEFGGRPRAVAHRPDGPVARSVDRIWLTFGQVMDTTSFALAADVVQFNGPNGSIPVTGFRWLNASRLEVSFDPQATAGAYELLLSPHILNAAGQALDHDGDGNRGETSDDQYSAMWTIVPPRIVSHAPDSFVAAPLDRLAFHFDRPMDPASFAVADDIVSFTGPDGASLTATGFVWPDRQTLAVTFAPQTTLGPYEMILGPNIRDTGGNPLDNDRDRIAGEVVGDQYRASFTLSDILFVSGAIDSNTAWGGLVIVEDNVTISAGVTLTINPGTTIKLHDQKAITLPAGAALQANGTTAQPIRFTSIHDDTVGGDSDLNGDRIQPESGDWRGIFVDGGTANFDHTIFRYGGGTTSGSWNDHAATIAVHAGGIANVTNSQLYDSFFDTVLSWRPNSQANLTNTVIAGGDRGINADATVRIVNSTLDDNRIGIWGHGGNYELVNSIISNSFESGVDHVLGTTATIRYSNVWSPRGQNYTRFASQTGTSGNVSVDPHFRIADNMDYRLAFGSPMIDSADGVAAPANDLFGAPRYDDPRTTNTGVSRPDQTFADRGAIEFVENATSRVDLVVPLVQVASHAMQGDLIVTQWQVTNVGSEMALGDWRDAVYLSHDAVWSPDDWLLGETVHEGGLPSGSSYSASAEFRFPGVTPGSYFVLVRGNSDGVLFEGINLTNNTNTQPPTVVADLPRLSVDVPFAASIATAGTGRAFKIDAPAGRDLKIQLTAPAGSQHELYLRHGEVPTRQSFDVRGVVIRPTEQSIVIGNTAGGTYYLLDYTVAPAANEIATLVATLPSFGINAVSPTEGGNGGVVTLSIFGAGFDQTTTAQLVDSAGSLLNASRVIVSGSGELHATFELRGRSTGAAEIRATNGGTTRTLTNAFSITNSNPGRLVVKLDVPDRVRVGRPFEGVIEYANDGGNDLPAALLEIATTGIDLLQLPGSSAPERATLRILATNEQAPLGVLPPNARGQIKFIGTSTSAGRETFRISAASYPGSPISWSTLESSLRPSGYLDSEWQTLFSAIRAHIGDTWDGFVATLAGAASEMPAGAGNPHSYDDVWRFEMQRIRAALTTTVRGRVVDPARGVPAADARLILWDATHNQSIETLSLADGSFMFAGVGSGEYQLIVEGFVLATPQTVTMVSSSMDLGTVPVSSGGTVKGTVVRDVTGAAVANAVVTAVANDLDVATTITDNQGQFIFRGLSPGSYSWTIDGADIARERLAVTTTVTNGVITPLNVVARGTGTLLGKVVAGGTPVNQAAVFLTIDGFQGASVATAADGTFIATGLAPGDYSVKVRAAGLAEQRVDGVTLAAGQIKDAGMITLSAGGTIAGQVTAAVGGVGVPFGFVEVRDALGQVLTIAQMDGSGNYRLTDLPIGNLTFAAQATGYLEWTSPVVVAAGQTTTVSPTLATAGRIAGTVFDGLSRPSAGVVVNLEGPSDFVMQTTTDLHGNYLLDDLPLGDFTVLFGGYEGAGGNELRTLSTATPRVTLDKTIAARLVSGRVFAVDGTTTVAEALVVLLRGSQQIATTATDANGRYQFLVMKAGTYDLVAWTEEQAFNPQLNVAVGANDVTNIDFRAGNSILSGVLVDEETSLPIPGAVIALSHPRFELGPASVAAAVTASDGSFSFAGLPLGDLELFAVREGFARVLQRVAVTGGAGGEGSGGGNDAGSSVTIRTTSKPAVVSGQITDPSGGPVTSGTVTIFRGSDGRIIGQSPIDANGRYTIPDDYPGDVSVMVNSNGHVQRIDNVTLRPGSQTHNVQIQPSTTHVRGTLTSDGRPIRDGVVVILDAQGRPRVVTTTQSDGTFETTSLPPGDYTVHSATPGRHADPRPLTVSAGQSVDDFSMPLEPTSVPTSNAGLLADTTPPQAGWYSNAFDPPPPSSPYVIPSPQSGCESLHQQATTYKERLAEAEKWLKEAQDSESPTWLGMDANRGESRARIIQATTNIINALSPFPKATFTATESIAKLKPEWLTTIASKLKNKEDVARFQRLFAFFYDNAASMGRAANDLINVATDTLKALRGGHLKPDTLITMNKLVFSLGGIAAKVSAEFLANEKFMKETLGQLADGASFLGAAFNVFSAMNNISKAIDAYNQAEKDLSARLDAVIAARSRWELTGLKLRRAIDRLNACNERKPDPGPFQPTFRLINTTNTQNGQSYDPNDKTGSAGPNGYIAPQAITYEIDFENDPALGATIPAQDVVVTDPLDTDFDITSIEFLDFGFNNQRFNVPPNLSHYETTIDLRSFDVNLVVAVKMEFDVTTRTLRASFRSLDPLTGQPPEDIDAGFLPVNDKQVHNGEGYFRYRLRPQSGVASGTQLTNQASIVFDVNAPILTPTTLHTIDLNAPVSQVTALPATRPADFIVNWSGSDDAGGTPGSGVASYDVFVSDNDAPFVLWRDDSVDASAVFAGEVGHTYRFYSVATDNVGHVEQKLAAAEATTTVVPGPPWQNLDNPRDVNHDGAAVAQDVLLIINELNTPRRSDPVTRALAERLPSDTLYYDVNGDDFITAQDALIIINAINNGTAEGETPTQFQVRLIDQAFEHDGGEVWSPTRWASAAARGRSSTASETGLSGDDFAAPLRTSRPVEAERRTDGRQRPRSARLRQGELLDELLEEAISNLVGESHRWGEVGE